MIFGRDMALSIMNIVHNLVSHDSPRVNQKLNNVQNYRSGSATVDLISSIDKSAVTLWTFTSEISA